MSILIKGMEIPVIELEWAIRHGADGKWYAVDTNAETSDGEWHEIVPVPKHGRLIDADALKQKIFSEPIVEDADDPRFNLYAKVQVAGAVNKIIEAVDDAPTIIPAEEGE